MSKSIILFDGVCNLCNGFVQFVIRMDPKAHFLFASLQSEEGRALLKQHGISEDLETVVLISNGKAYTESDVALEAGWILGGIWRPFYILKWVFPRPLRNIIYRWIARNRYRWFGKKDQCMIPTPELRSRFL